MSIVEFLTLFGGLAIFLYGMKLMGDGLEKTAGDRMQKIIEAVTSNRVKGVLVGTAVTAIIQSSSATTVMVVGFVNAGIMTLTQAVGVIMGANIGTTVTAQIIRLGDISANAWYLNIFKPSFLAPIAAALGVGLIMFNKKKKINNIGEIIAGFGLLFIGMGTMEGAVQGLRELPQFKQMFMAFSNPILGVLVGAGVTAIIQSSSASVGILQAAASTGLVSFSAAVPIILGQNIGTCVTALLSSIGANKNAKKAAMIHLFFNITGTIIFLGAVYIYQGTIGFPFWNDPINRGGIADFHTFFNIANTIILFPFAGVLVKMAHLAIRGKEERDEVQTTLDERFISTPSVAVSQAVKEVVRMGEVAKLNVSLSIRAILDRNISSMGKIEDNEDLIDEMETKITRYLVKVANEPLSKEENKLVSALFHVITDFERIGDHATNLSEIAEYIVNHDIEFSQSAIGELTNMVNAVEEIMDLTVTSFERQDVKMAMRIQPCEDVIDLLKETLRIRHIDRLSQQRCNLKAGVIFLDIVNNFERIGDHCSNIGVSIEQLNSPRADFDIHQYLRSVHQDKTPEYEKMYAEYEKKYGIS